MYIWNLILILLFIITTAFFVASEFSIVRVRRTRLQQYATEGNKRAMAALRVTGNLDGYLSACQLGITLTALGLGWIGEPTINDLLHPLFVRIGIHESLASIISLALSFSVITFLHVVVGELAPKTVAIQRTDMVSLWSAKPLIFFYKVMYPFIWVLNNSARKVAQLMGLKPAKEHEIAHSVEEIRTILNQSYTSGQINKEELHYMNNIFQFDDRLGKEIMVPRTEIAFLDTEMEINQNILTIHSEKYTRFPVISNGDKDEVIGIVNTKEIFFILLDKKIDSIKEFIRPVLHVPETIPIRDLLKKMQKHSMHMAILVDEYGGTAGLVTVEDILEEIVGEIRDEFDKEEEPLIQEIDPKHYVVDGKVLVTDINHLMVSHLDDSEIDTIGGWVYSHAPELKEGVQFQEEDIQVTIVDLDHYRVKKIEIEKLDPHP
jgi:CBS domain containing-hemolysin-like protein